MKHGNVSLKRYLAMILVVVMVATNLSGLTLPVGAAGDEEITVSIGELVAENYDLTDAEKELLKSGYLVSDNFTYVAPTNNDELITVDTENAKITAESYKGWKPVKATIVYGDQEMSVTLTDGVGYYDAAVVGNAFSVKVDYELVIDAEGYNVQQLLDAAGYLKQGIANLDVVSGQSGNLYILEQAMPSLVELAEMVIQIGNTGSNITLSEEGKAAIHALNDQMTANGGQLTLSTMIAEYDAGYKTEYLTHKGAAMLTSLEELLVNLVIIEEALTTLAANVEVFIQYGLVDAALGEQLKTLSGIVTNLTNALTDVSEDPWTAANLGTDLVKANANFQKLDNLVAAVETPSNLQAKSTLKVAAVTLQHNMSMFNVTVQVVLRKVVNNEVVVFNTQETVLTLSENATKAEILAAIAEANCEADAITAWGEAYEEGRYDVVKADLPGTLTEDITYTITYSPKYYNVTIAGETASFPYGYELTLPRHADSTKAYDYYMNGNYYAQGSVITVTGDMVFTREEGAAYVAGNLLQIIAANADNARLTAILNSGALTVNENVNYREPADLEALVTLTGNELTALTYASDYEGLYWAPYTYVVDGVEYFFNGNTEVTIAGDFSVVNVYYRLTLTNYGAAKTQDVLDLVAVLVEEAAGQKSVLDRLASFEGEMAGLDKIKFAALNGVIDVADISDELKADFKAVVSSIINNALDKDGYLKIYHIVKNYNDENNGGLAYYYANYEHVRYELDLLTSYLNQMLVDDAHVEALTVLMASAGYGSYAEKITDLKDKLNEVNRDLTAPNEAIDVESDGLRALCDGLTMQGDLSNLTAVVPYLQLGPVTKTADKYVSVTVKVTIGGNTYTSDAVTVLKGQALTAAQVNALKDWVAATVESKLGNKAAYYNNDFAASQLDALVGTALNDNVSFNYTWTAKTYTVKIDGEADQTITVENLTIKLPGHPDAANGWSYKYNIGGATYASGSFTFKVEHLDTLFTNGVLTITRTEVNQKTEKLENMVANVNNAMGYQALVLVKQNGEYVGLNANINAANLMDFVMALMESGYSYIGLNNEGLLYLEEESSSLEISIQTLINAILSDDDFGSNTIIALGNNGKGKLLGATMQLGNSATEIQYENLKFTINFTSVPSQLTTAANALEKVKSYISFHSENGVLVFDLNLPDAVYGAYLTALMTTGHVDKTNVNAVNQQIAIQFLYDYFQAVITSDMDAETFTNSLEMLGINRDLTAYGDYYDYFCSFMNGDSTTVTIDDTGAQLDVSVSGKAVIDNMLKLVGVDAADMALYLSMVKEYKGGNIYGSTKAVLENADKTYVAMIIDLEAAGVTDKYACPAGFAALANKTANLAGTSAVILLEDVTGNLTFSGTTILDLNGKTIDGSVTSTGKLYIIDSSMDTYKAGTITGKVSGSVVILAGNFNEKIGSYLQDGYFQDGTTVRNELYYITDENGEVTIMLDSDVLTDGNLPSYRAVAVNIATDLLLNYFTAAGMSVDGNELYNMHLDDLLGLLNSDSKVDDLIYKGLETINVPGFSNLVNSILADLLDFAAIEEALANDKALATYTMTTAPWMVSLDHVKDGNYLTVGIFSNPELAKTVSVSLVITGDNSNYVEKLAGELKEIVDAAQTHITVNFNQPNYADKVMSIVGTGEAVAVIDMSNNSDYAVMIGVILAYGNEAKRAAVAEAINSGNINDLEAVVNNTTVAELFTALKAMSRTVNFAAMAKKVGVTANVASAAELESVYHLILCAAGRTLEELKITGMNSRLGNLDKNGDGWYVLTKADIFREDELSARGYTGAYDLTATELTLKVKLFGEQEPEQPHEHVWSAWTVTTPAGCTTTGIETRTCECGEVETRVIPALGHAWSEWEVTTEPTCTEPGVETRVCGNCGEVETREIAALGHAWGEWKVTTEPTCTEPGVETRVCGNCGETETREIAALGHAWGEWLVTTEPTCTGNGLETRVCANCGKTETRVVSPIGHAWGEWLVTTEPTCTETGVESRVCGNCGGIETREIAALGHSLIQHEAKAPTCTEHGWDAYVECENCDYTTYVEIPALGHAWGEWNVTTEPTCTEPGVESRVCGNCGEIETREVPAMGHDYDEDGVCKHCGDKNPATGSLIIGGIAALMAAAATGGVIMYTRRKKENEEA